MDILEFNFMETGRKDDSDDLEKFCMTEVFGAGTVGSCLFGDRLHRYL